MSEWWDSIPVFVRVFWYIAVPFSVVFLIQLVLTFLGMDEGDGEVDTDGFDNDESGMLEGAFKPFTVKNFIIFFTVFGWSGIAFYNSGLSETLTVVISVIVGIAVMFLVAGLFYFITRLAESGNIDYKTAIGHKGKVYVPIPAKEEGSGKIHITFQGVYKEVDAVTRGKALPTGVQVKVVDVYGDNMFLVEKN